MKPESDNFSSLFKRAKSGERSAREELARQSLEALRRHFHGRLGRLKALEQTDDVVTTTVFEVMEILPQLDFRAAAQYYAFLYQCAGNQMRDLARYHGADRRRSFDLLGEGLPDIGAPLLDGRAALEPGPKTLAEQNDELRRLEECLGELPDEDARLVRMKGQGYSVSEIARTVGQTRNIVERKLNQAIAHLSRCLSKKRNTEDMT